MSVALTNMEISGILLPNLDTFGRVRTGPDAF
jgi:hypothetical protein